jgi:lipoic acid synthetase
VPLPKYLVKPTPKLRQIRQLRSLIADDQLNTVCESAKCPNIGECYVRNTLTFMILGNTCTRSCTFCGVNRGRPLPPDPFEPERIAQAVQKLGLKYVVVTSVTRDDLPDGGAGQFAKVIRELRELRVEVLIPDFQGEAGPLQAVLDADPYVLNHNVETAPRLYPTVRPQANYQRSLNLLKQAKKLKPSVYTKSGFMVGLGEEKDEVFAVLTDLKVADCDLATIGQYLPPSRQHPSVARYVEPVEFAEYAEFGKKLGLRVKAGPFVRSSYQAGETINEISTS